MKEYPILFSGAMVRAILDGLKTQTRRTLSQQPLEILTKRPPWEQTVTRKWNGCKVWFGLMQRNPNRGTAFRCKYGEVGDRLWVKETFSVIEDRVVFRATLEGVNDGRILKWKPSIFMPRKASRITLEIVKVRVELLQDICDADVEAEGLEPNTNVTAKSDYAVLWSSINGVDSWRANPWVWVIEFKAGK